MLLGGNLCSLSSIVFILALIHPWSHPLVGLSKVNKKTDLFNRSFDLEGICVLRP